MIGIVKKSLIKLNSLSQFTVVFIKRKILLILGILSRRMLAHPRIAAFAVRILNKFPYLKSRIRRLISLNLTEIRLTHHAQQIEADLLQAIKKKKGL